MTLLLDSSILLEFLLDQEHADEVGDLLQAISGGEFFITRFTLDSMGVILLRRKLHDLMLRTVKDLFITGSARLIQLESEDTAQIIEAALKFSLDFDDAYQYVVAEKYDLTLVSFDTDFDRTERGRKTPIQILKTF